MGNNRTAAMWIDNLLESPRFKLAKENFDIDPSLMKAIMIEIILETQEITKFKIKKVYAKNHTANKAVILDYIDKYNDYSGYTRPWNMTPTELKLYSLDPKFQMTDKQREKALEMVRKQLMDEKFLVPKQENPVD